MTRTPRSTGLLSAVAAAVAFGLSGPFVEPLLDSGWTPGAAVAVRAAIGGIVLLPFAVSTQRGRYRALWAARWRVLAMAALGVVGTQLCYFSAIEHIPVSTAILIEYTAPVLLVLTGWVLRRRRPAAVVLIGAGTSIAGLLLVVSPSGQALDPLGVLLAAGATVCLAVYFVVSAGTPGDVSSVAFAAASLLVGAALLGVLGVLGVVELSAAVTPVEVLGRQVPWWLPTFVIGLVATAFAYATSIVASRLLGSRLASFAGLLEVVAAAVSAWILLGQTLAALQLTGGLLVLVGIAFVRAERVSGSGASA
ncbi:EamA family transporter [Curtobacterium sp. YC1]|uniref:EamA family transporter n=1 Tax=Curtobacterium sp. YC1 TaxID=2795488 RepID=UPI0018E56AED|nr:EamA family transporter [Curtobacterium sp. YC1]QQD75215.1 EamA family transporter [Curtobacterium sp. YC1]